MSMSINTTQIGNDSNSPDGASRLGAAEADLKSIGISNVRFSLVGLRKHSLDSVYSAVAEVLEAVLREEKKS